LGVEFIKVVVYILPWREPKISALNKNKPLGEAGADTTRKAVTPNMMSPRTNTIK
jgi:hypothetical protein